MLNHKWFCLFFWHRFHVFFCFCFCFFFFMIRTTLAFASSFKSCNALYTGNSSFIDYSIFHKSQCSSTRCVRLTLPPMVASSRASSPWASSAAPWDAWCPPGSRSSPLWPPGPSPDCRRRQTRSTSTGSSVCRWTPWPRSHCRRAGTWRPDPYRWTPAADGRWKGCSPRVLKRYKGQNTMLIWRIIC